MLRDRFTRPFICLLLVAGWAGTAPAEKYYSVCGNSGGQLHFGKGLAIPIQTAAGPATTATIFPKLLIPVKPGAPIVTGTVDKTTLLVNGPKRGYQQKLVVPANVLSKAAAKRQWV